VKYFVGSVPDPISLLINQSINHIFVVVVLVFLFLSGQHSYKKAKALAFQIGSGLSFKLNMHRLMGSNF